MAIYFFFLKFFSSLLDYYYLILVLNFFLMAVLTMKIMIWLTMIIITISCASNKISQTNTNSTPVATGWSDDDTYTVRVSDKTEDDAVKAAKHKILKDIVDVRLRNNSRYTDIVKIRDEFDMPLRNGVIVKRQQKPDELTIYYQIRDKGLKKKFQRQ
jgi:hypothetical protein